MLFAGLWVLGFKALGWLLLGFGLAFRLLRLSSGLGFGLGGFRV